jgi:hypothetical protein
MVVSGDFLSIKKGGFEEVVTKWDLTKKHGACS